MRTIFSEMHQRFEGPLTDLVGHTDGRLDAEWFSWILTQLARESTRLPSKGATAKRFCYLIVQREQGPGYVQFAAGADGSFVAEVASNQSLGVEAIGFDDAAFLVALGWHPPESDALGSRPNYRVELGEPTPGRTALIALRALVDVFGVRSADQLRYAYFEALRDVDARRGERVSPPEQLT